MSHGIYTAAAGALARQSQVDVEANNLANTNTAGFRAAKLAFASVLEDEQAPTRALVAPQETRLSTAPGPRVATGDGHDLALDGPGFFALEDPAGPLLVRSLSLQPGEGGRLVDGSGRGVRGEGGVELAVDPGRPFEIGGDGTLSQLGKRIGRVATVQVAAEEALAPVGGGAYRATEASGEAREAAVPVLTGVREGSNVQPVESMVNLIRLERDFQSLLRAVNAHREADQHLVDQVLR